MRDFVTYLIEEKNMAAGGVMHEGQWSVLLGFKGMPALAEELIVARDIMLARQIDWYVHLQHLSTAESVRMVREARARGIKVTAETPPIHSAHPKPGGNMVTIVTGALLDNNLLTEADAKKAAFLKAVSLDVDGEMFGVKTVGVGMGDLTLALLDIIEVDGKIEFGINMRYPMGTTYEEVLAKVTATAAANGFEVVDTYCGVRPYLLDKDWEIITELNKISNEITGDDKAPYTLSGGTYAHCLPNGLAFGFSGNKTPEDFPKGHGGAHGKDESVSLDRLQRGMRIYARSMLALNDMEW